MNLIENCKQIWHSLKKNLSCTDELLKENYDRNPFHPFRQAESYTFELSYKFKEQCLANGCGSLCLFWASMQLCKLIVDESKDGTRCPSILYMFLFVASLIAMFYLLAVSIISYKSRFLVLDLLEHSYEFYFNRKLMHKAGLDRLCVRLNRKYVVKNSALYCLVLEGQRIDQIEITTYNSNLRTLRKLGKSIADNLTLNFVDCTNSDGGEHYALINVSKPTNTDMWSFLKDNKSIYVEKSDPHWIMPSIYSDLRDKETVCKDFH